MVEAVGVVVEVEVVEVVVDVEEVVLLVDVVVVDVVVVLVVVERNSRIFSNLNSSNISFLTMVRNTFSTSRLACNNSAKLPALMSGFTRLPLSSTSVPIAP